jgi:hypothetical protein
VSFNSGLCACKGGVLLLGPYLQSILVCLFWKWGLMNYLPGLASNLNPPNPNLLSSWDYRHEPPVPGHDSCFEHYCVLSIRTVSGTCSRNIASSCCSLFTFFPPHPLHSDASFLFSLDQHILGLEVWDHSQRSQYHTANWWQIYKVMWRANDCCLTSVKLLCT